MRFTEYVTDDVKKIVEMTQKEKTPQSQKNLFHGLMKMQEKLVSEKKAILKQQIRNYVKSQIDIKDYKLDIEISDNLNRFVFVIVGEKKSYRCFRVSYMGMDHWDLEHFDRVLLYRKCTDHLLINLHLMSAIVKSLEKTGFMGFSKDFFEILISHEANARFYKKQLNKLK